MSIFWHFVVNSISAKDYKKKSIYRLNPRQAKNFTKQRNIIGMSLCRLFVEQKRALFAQNKANYHVAI